MSSSSPMSKVVAKPSLPISTGVRCLEQNVKEVDSAVREFVQRIGGFGVAKLPPSWKFPHKSLDMIDTIEVLDNYRSQSHESLVTPDEHYQHLLELLIDRLYFAFLASAKFVKIISNTLPVSQLQQKSSKESSGKLSLGQKSRSRSTNSIQTVIVTAKGDGPGSGDGYIDEFELEESIGIGQGFGFTGLPISNPFLPSESVHGSNLGFLMKQFYSRLSVVDSALHIHLDKCTKKTSRTSIGSGSSRKKSELLIQPVHIGSQTDEKSLSACASCVATQNILKTIGETIEYCLVAITKEESGIKTAKEQLRNNLFWCTQWSAATRWCEALQLDTNLIVKRMTETLKKNVSLQDEVKTLQHSLNIQKRDHTTIVEALEKRLFQLGQELAVETKGKAELIKIKDSVELRVRELESEVLNKCENIRKECEERSKLEEALKSLEKVHHELKENQEKTLEDFKTINEHLGQDSRDKELMKEQLLKYTDELLLKDSKITILEESVAELGKTRDENRMLRKRIESLKESESNPDVQSLSSENADQSDQIGTLKKQLELLTVYPDLNGPINPPDSEFLDKKDILATMEDQVRANHLRIKLLTEQTEKLSSTVLKVQKHIESQNKKLNSNNTNI